MSETGEALKESIWGEKEKLLEKLLEKCICVDNKCRTIRNRIYGSDKEIGTVSEKPKPDSSFLTKYSDAIDQMHSILDSISQNLDKIS